MLLIFDPLISLLFRFARHFVKEVPPPPIIITPQMRRAMKEEERRREKMEQEEKVKAIKKDVMRSLGML